MKSLIPIDTSKMYPLHTKLKENHRRHGGKIFKGQRTRLTVSREDLL